MGSIYAVHELSSREKSRKSLGRAELLGFEPGPCEKRERYLCGMQPPKQSSGKTIKLSWVR